MKPASPNKTRWTRRWQTRERASIRVVLLALVCFFLGVAATAAWFHFAAKPAAENPTPPSAARPAASAASAPSPARPIAVISPPVDAAAIAEVKRAIPNYASLSVEDGTKILRQTALKECAAAVKDMDVQVQQARQQLVQAESSRSQADQQAAMKHLQQTQAAEAAKIQEIAARLQAQIAALKKIKNVK